jgi:hypothetical protein
MIPPRQAALEQAFLQSVIYASLFDYPVTLGQLREGLIGQRATEHDLARCYTSSLLLQATVEWSEPYYFPRGRRDLLDTRRRREARSRQLLADLAMPLALMTAMPFVRMVALSGSLAHLNAEAEADLDLFVITRPGRVWSVTVTALAIARLFGWRARLCLNYVISERALMVGPADLFCANQIVHLQPMSGHSTYLAFLKSNRFVERFYPNFRARSEAGSGRSRLCGLRHAVEWLTDWTIAPIYERVCRFAYRQHLRRRAHTWRSRDQVRLENDCLKLHTSSHRREVMEKFECALESAVDQARAESLTLAESSLLQAAR